MPVNKLREKQEDCSIWNNDHRHAQRRTGYACIAFGILLLKVGLNAMVSFIRPGGLLGGIFVLMATYGIRITVVVGGLAGLAAAHPAALGAIRVAPDGTARPNL